MLAMALGMYLNAFVMPRNLGFVSGEAGMLQLFAGSVRIPDLAFVSWARLPDGFPTEPIPLLAPDLAVEILSRTNTPREMARKRRDYFRAGVRLIWEIDPRDRTITVYTSLRKSRVLQAGDVLDGGEVLPGFTLPLTDLFAQLDRQADR
jgi:Uma2 family endonuclease